MPTEQHPLFDSTSGYSRMRASGASHVDAETRMLSYCRHRVNESSEKPADKVKPMRISVEDRFAIVCEGDTAWKVELANESRTASILFIHTAPITFLRAIGDGLYVTGSSDGLVRIWRPSEQLGRTVMTFYQQITAVSVNTAGDIAAADEGGTVKIWHRDLQAVEATFLCDPTISALLLVSPQRLLVGHESGRLDCHNVDQNGVVSIQQHGGAVTSIVSVSSNRVASASSQGGIAYWDIGSQNGYLTHDGSVSRLASVSTGTFVAGSAEGKIELWSESAGGVPERLASLDTETFCDLAIGDSSIYTIDKVGEVRCHPLLVELDRGDIQKVTLARHDGALAACPESGLTLGAKPNESLVFVVNDQARPCRKTVVAMETGRLRGMREDKAILEVSLDSPHVNCQFRILVLPVATLKRLRDAEYSLSRKSDQDAVCRMLQPELLSRNFEIGRVLSSLCDFDGITDEDGSASVRITVPTELKDFGEHELVVVVFDCEPEGTQE